MAIVFVDSAHILALRPLGRTIFVHRSVGAKRNVEILIVWDGEGRDSTPALVSAGQLAVTVSETAQSAPFIILLLLRLSVVYIPRTRLNSPPITWRSDQLYIHRTKSTTEANRPGDCRTAPYSNSPPLSKITRKLSGCPEPIFASMARLP
jgi:hypothetical protein